jgi:hypothetical protein
LTFVWDPSDPPSSLLEEDSKLATKKAVSKTVKKSAENAVSKKSTINKMVTKRASPRQNVARVRAARRDASIAAITKRIQKAFKLPDGSVKLVLPNGKKAHADGRILNLLSKWDST